MKISKGRLKNLLNGEFYNNNLHFFGAVQKDIKTYFSHFWFEKHNKRHKSDCF